MYFTRLAGKMYLFDFFPKVCPSLALSQAVRGKMSNDEPLLQTFERGEREARARVLQHFTFTPFD